MRNLTTSNSNRKIFLYLYPIFEYQRIFIMSDKYYEINGIKKPFVVLSECIQKRYRDNGYEVIIANYPDKEDFGFNIGRQDKIVYTDITFKDASGYNEDGSRKEESEVKYPSEEYLINQIGVFDELVIGGYHSSDCVKRVAEYAYNKGIDVMIDLELTEQFFTLYKQSYFKKELYNPANYKQYLISLGLKYNENIDEINTQLTEKFSSPIYKMEDYEPTIIENDIINNQLFRRKNYR